MTVSRSRLLATLCLLCTLPFTVNAEQSALPTNAEGTLANDTRGPMARTLLDLNTRSKEPVPADLQRLYALANFEPIWTDDSNLNRHGSSLVALLSGARADGLQPQDYGSDELAALKRGFESSARQQNDIDLSVAALRYASDLTYGRLQPDDFDLPGYDRRQMDLPLEIHNRLEANAVQTIRELAPPHRGYAVLREGLHRYQAIEDEGGWPRVEDGPTLRLCDVDAAQRITSLRRRLAIQGYEAGGRADDSAECSDVEAARPSGPSETTRARPQRAVFDAALSSALREFQSDHGIEADGILGPASLAELNRGVAERIQQIEISMDRWRWLPRDLGETYVRVNIPAYELDYVVDGKVREQIEVVVGKPNSPTPLFQDEIEHVVFNPYWNVPRSIATNEILPKLKNDPTYLDRKNMELVVDGETVEPPLDWSKVSRSDFEYRIRQRPGRRNALGRVKLLFPNKYAVYLHDTNHPSAFERTDRALSHGCVRVGEPFALADRIAADELAERGLEVDEVLAGGERHWIRLDEPVPVYLTYATARVTPQRRIEFHQDLYGLDEEMSLKLEQRKPRRFALASIPAG